MTHAGASGTTSLLELQDAARQLGLEAEAVRLDPRRPIAWDLPTILHLNGNHFVAVLPDGDGRLVVADPPAAPRVVVGPGELGGWDGIALVAASAGVDLDRALAKHHLVRAPVQGGPGVDSQTSR
jgi:ABC-type bacteriocin/lantibiotic exporter with double-glycine peptidase domain